MDNAGTFFLLFSLFFLSVLKGSAMAVRLWKHLACRGEGGLGSGRNVQAILGTETDKVLICSVSSLAHMRIWPRQERPTLFCSQQKQGGPDAPLRAVLRYSLSVLARPGFRQTSTGSRMIGCRSLHSDLHIPVLRKVLLDGQAKTPAISAARTVAPCKDGLRQALMSRAWCLSRVDEW